MLTLQGSWNNLGISAFGTTAGMFVHYPDGSLCDTAGLPATHPETTNHFAITTTIYSEFAGALYTFGGLMDGHVPFGGRRICKYWK